MQPVLTFIFIHFGKTHSTKAKKPKLLFSLVKNSVYDLWLVRCSFFTCEENHLTYLNLCSFLQINFLFKFSLEKNLSTFLSIFPWRVTYYKPTCTHTHFKNVGPSKTLPTAVGYHNRMSIKLKTSQVSRQVIHVGNWTNNAQLSSKCIM